MNAIPSDVTFYRDAIRDSGLSIYDEIEIGSRLYVPSTELEAILDAGLRGFCIKGCPLRTRSKLVKSEVCKLLGYPVPLSFKRIKPRFPGQGFDTYVQSADNLQIWNEQLTPTRRYVLIRDTDGFVSKVRVVTGETLAAMDTTGKLTQKYQARLVPGKKLTEMVSNRDSGSVMKLLSSKAPSAFTQRPTSYPEAGQVLPIGSIFERLSGLVGKNFPDRGIVQERNRGGDLHRLVCQALGYRDFADDGRFPDVKHQLLEVKLQTAATIDLGLITPDSTEPLDIPKIGLVQLKHSDVRYGMFYASTDGKKVTLERFYLATGSDFFRRFPRCEGRVLNRKLQIHLPRDFFGNSKC